MFFSYMHMKLLEYFYIFECFDRSNKDFNGNEKRVKIK